MWETYYKRTGNKILNNKQRIYQENWKEVHISISTKFLTSWFYYSQHKTLVWSQGHFLSLSHSSADRLTGYFLKKCQMCYLERKSYYHFQKLSVVLVDGNKLLQKIWKIRVHKIYLSRWLEFFLLKGWLF